MLITAVQETPPFGLLAAQRSVLAAVEMGRGTLDQAPLLRLSASERLAPDRILADKCGEFAGDAGLGGIPGKVDRSTWERAETVVSSPENQQREENRGLR